MKFECCYIPIGVGTFHIESAQKEFELSSKMLKSICSETVCPDEMLLSNQKLNDFLLKINPDIVVVQNVTFANASYISEIAKRFDCPIILWTLPEPVIDGGRLRLNSLTGAFSAGNTLKMLGRNFDYVFGSPSDIEAIEKINAVIKASKLKKTLKSLNFLQIGYTPEGFGFGRGDDIEMQKYFGVTLHSAEAREFIDMAKSFSDEAVEEYLISAQNKTKGLEKIPEKNRRDFARLCKAYIDYCKTNNIGAVSSRCWPDYFTSFGTPVCAVLAMLGDIGIPAACEADTYGALSMYIAQYLTETPSFFGDPVSMNEEENTITFWHCGTAAFSLARKDTGACVSVHCNRKVGPTLDFGCKPNDKATVIRIGKKQGGGFRMFISSGSILNKPKQFNGTSLVFKPNSNAAGIINNAVLDGWEPHFAVAYGDIKNEVATLCKMLNIDSVFY